MVRLARIALDVACRTLLTGAMAAGNGHDDADAGSSLGLMAGLLFPRDRTPLQEEIRPRTLEGETLF
jgi:hypothetical protein